MPHDLGVLGHYDAILWYLGDNRLTQDPEDELISTPFGQLPDIGVAERQQYLTMSVRDYLNEGGKLVHAGETAQYSGLPGIGDVVGGLFYGLNGDPTAECVVQTVPGFFEDCLLLADDFRQYYLGGSRGRTSRTPRASRGSPTRSTATPQTSAARWSRATTRWTRQGRSRRPARRCSPDEFPQFESAGAAEYPLELGSPFAPIEGTRYAGALHADSSYMRLSKTVTVPAGAQSAQLQFQLSINTEPQYDNVIVEARTVGQENWTTLPEIGGATQTDPPAECSDPAVPAADPPVPAPLLQRRRLHGAGLERRLELVHRLDGRLDPGGVRPVRLCGSAGGAAISYVTDPSTGGVGAFVDDTRVVIDGVTDADGFEGATSTWAPGDPPADSPPNSGNWQIGERLVNSFAATSTEDSLLLGFGLEQLATDADRSDLLARALDGLLD